MKKLNFNNDSNAAQIFDEKVCTLGLGYVGLTFGDRIDWLATDPRHTGLGLGTDFCR